MRILVVSQEGLAVAAFSVADTATEVELSKLKQRMYEARKEELKAAFAVLHPGRPVESIKYPDLPDVTTNILHLGVLENARTDTP